MVHGHGIFDKLHIVHQHVTDDDDGNDVRWWVCRYHGYFHDHPPTKAISFSSSASRSLVLGGIESTGVDDTPRF